MNLNTYPIPPRLGVNLAALLCAALVLLAAPRPGATQATGDAFTTDSAKPLARVGDRTISIGDVAPELAFQVYRRQLDIYSLLEHAAEALAERLLLEGEAAKRGVSVDALLHAEVDAQARPADERQVDAYMAAHPEAQGQPGARERIAHYLTEKAKIERRLALLERLRKESGFEMLLRPPLQPRVRLRIDEQPARGPADAPVSIVHFATFTSPRSARSAAYIDRLRSELGGRICQIHVNFVNEHDEIGLAAAQLAARAHRADLFWQLHDRLFTLEGGVSFEDLQRIASELELQPIAPGDSTELETVKHDIDLGNHIGVNSEPVLFINGRYFSGTFPFERLREIVGEELGEKLPADVATRLAD